MKTLYLRNVPDEVGSGSSGWRREGMSVSAFATRELAVSPAGPTTPGCWVACPIWPCPQMMWSPPSRAGRAER